MAYLAGNAVYISHTVKAFTEFEDYRYMCGAGVHVGDNVFEENIGLKKHNGGAYMHRCIHLTNSTG